MSGKIKKIPIFYLLPAKSIAITYYRYLPKNSIGNYLCTKVTPRFQIESTGILYNSAGKLMIKCRFSKMMLASAKGQSIQE